ADASSAQRVQAETRSARTVNSRRRASGLLGSSAAVGLAGASAGRVNSGSGTRAAGNHSTPAASRLARDCRSMRVSCASGGGEGVVRWAWSLCGGGRRRFHPPGKGGAAPGWGLFPPPPGGGGGWGGGGEANLLHLTRATILAADRLLSGRRLS